MRPKQIGPWSNVKLGHWVSRMGRITYEIHDRSSPYRDNRCVGSDGRVTFDEADPPMFPGDGWYWYRPDRDGQPWLVDGPFEDLEQAMERARR